MKENTKFVEFEINGINFYTMADNISDEQFEDLKKDYGMISSKCKPDTLNIEAFEKNIKQLLNIPIIEDSLDDKKMDEAIEKDFEDEPEDDFDEYDINIINLIEEITTEFNENNDRFYLDIQFNINNKNANVTIEISDIDIVGDEFVAHAYCSSEDVNPVFSTAVIYKFLKSYDFESWM